MDEPLRYTYDAVADAVYLYLVDDIGWGEAKRSGLVPLDVKGASVTVDFDEDGKRTGGRVLRGELPVHINGGGSIRTRALAIRL